MKKTQKVFLYIYYNYTPLYYAVGSRKVQIVDYILKNCRNIAINETTKSGILK